MASQTRWEFKFGFAKYGEDPFKKGRKSYTLGVTNRGMTQGKWSICSYLTYEHVEALLMNNLTSADKMAVQYSTANTVRTNFFIDQFPRSICSPPRSQDVNKG